MKYPSSNQSASVIPFRRREKPPTRYHRKTRRDYKVGDAAIREIRRILEKPGEGVGR